MVAGVCWSMSYLVFRLWGSRGGGGGLLVQVIFGVLALGVLGWWRVSVGSGHIGCSGCGGLLVVCGGQGYVLIFMGG